MGIGHVCPLPRRWRSYAEHAIGGECWSEVGQQEQRIHMGRSRFECGAEIQQCDERIDKLYGDWSKSWAGDAHGSGKAGPYQLRGKHLGIRYLYSKQD